MAEHFKYYLGLIIKTQDQWRFTALCLNMDPQSKISIDDFYGQIQIDTINTSFDILLLLKWWYEACSEKVNLQDIQKNSMGKVYPNLSYGSKTDLMSGVCSKWWRSLQKCSTVFQIGLNVFCGKYSMIPPAEV